MDFIDEVRTRSDRFAKRTEHLHTEEATKSALVLPFIQMLGYEIFDSQSTGFCTNCAEAKRKSILQAINNARLAWGVGATHIRFACKVCALEFHVRRTLIAPSS